MSRWITFDTETTEALRSKLDTAPEMRDGDALQAAVESQNAVILLPASDHGLLVVRLQRRRELPIEHPSEGLPGVERQAEPQSETPSDVAASAAVSLLEAETAEVHSTAPEIGELDLPEGQAIADESAAPEIAAPEPASNHDEWTEHMTRPLPEVDPWWDAPQPVVQDGPEEEWSDNLVAEEEVIPSPQAGTQTTPPEPDSMRFTPGGLLGLRDEPVDEEEEKPKKWWQRILE